MSRNEGPGGLLRAIYRGDDGPSAGRGRLLAGEGGMMTYVALIMMLFFLALFMMLMNVGRIVIEKVEIQNAADSSAFSGALWGARGMNAVTATNHLMGEMMSLVVVHEAIAGKDVDGLDLDSRDRRRSNRADRLLRIVGPGARRGGGWTVTYRFAIQPLRAAETVGQAKINLKELLVWLYTAQIAASKVPWGWPIVQALNVLELVILAEWKALDVLEDLARRTLPLKNVIYGTLLPAAKRYEDEVERMIPALAVATCAKLSELNDCSGTLFPGWPRLPIVQEPFDARDSDHQRSMAGSQIVRATYPWVNYDRQPILTATSWMVFSGANGLYRHWTDFDTTEKTWDFYREGGSYLYIVQGSRQDLKGSESWTTDSREADRLFAVIGFAHRPPIRPFGAVAFATQNPDGRVAYAQALVYNAGSQAPGVGPPVFQREVGWDTLNWDAPVTDASAYEFPGGRYGTPRCPRIRVNWQAKLVPVTPRLDDSLGELRPPFHDAISRLVPVAPPLRTH
jgi:hypothetical protein